VGVLPRRPVVVKVHMDPTMAAQILNHGVATFPAYKRYPLQPSGLPMTVTCDRCKRANLSACIGFRDQDLCGKCFDDVAEAFSPAGPYVATATATATGGPYVPGSAMFTAPAPRHASAYGAHGVDGEDGKLSVR
jgi:hypothetical protein